MRIGHQIEVACYARDFHPRISSKKRCSLGIATVFNPEYETVFLSPPSNNRLFN